MNNLIYLTDFEYTELNSFLVVLMETHNYSNLNLEILNVSSTWSARRERKYKRQISETNVNFSLTLEQQSLRHKQLSCKLCF